MTIAATLQRYLDAHDVTYQVVTHPATGSSSETAQVAHISGDRIAKAVVLSDDGGYVVAVVPASHHLRPEWLEQVVGRTLSLATERDAGRLFPDCEIGAIPPVGPAYGQDVVLDERLADLDEVYFEGGDHQSLVKVSGDAFVRLMGPAPRGIISAHD